MPQFAYMQVEPAILSTPAVLAAQRLLDRLAALPQSSEGAFNRSHIITTFHSDRVCRLGLLDHDA